MDRLHLVEDLNESSDEESDEIKSGESVSLQDFFEINGQAIIPRHNIADLIDSAKLSKIGQYVKEGYESDWDSMQDWRDQVEMGLELSKQERSSRSEPWQGAANFKSPILMNACLTFSDRASTELLRAADLCQVNVVGEDDQGIKQERADRVSIFQNWQLNVEMPEWRDEQEKLLYNLPYHGTVFKKTYYDSSLGRMVSDLVSYPSFAVNNTVTSIDKLRRFSEVFEYPKNVTIEKMRSGLWSDVDLSDSTDDEDYERDNVIKFIEQQTFCDLDDDGYEEPYTIVVQESTGKVVRVTPRFNLSDVVIKTEGQDATLENVFMANSQGIQVGEIEVIRVTPSNSQTKYGFLPDPQGGLLDVGYSHLLSATVSGINAITNQLVDSGTLENLQSGFVSTEFRMKQGDSPLRPGEFRQSGLMAQDLQNGIMLAPTKPPSQTLFSLMQMMVQGVQESSASADLSSSLGANAPAATTLALVQEQQLSSGAIIQRIYRSMSKEFDKLFKLNAKFTDPKTYMRVVDDQQADFSQDFNPNDLDIVPSANPEISSKIQRIQQATAEMANIEQVVSVGGNPRPIVENYYKAIGATNVNEVFPELSPQEQLDQLLQANPDLIAQIAQTADMQAEMAELQKQNLALTNKMIDAQANDLQAKAIKMQTESDIAVASTSAELDQAHADIQKTHSETMLNLEKAETEQVKNGIDVYTAGVNAQVKLTGVLNDRRMEIPPSNNSSI